MLRTWWQRRNAPAYAGPSLLRGFAPDQPGPGPMSGGSGGGSGRSPVTLEKADFDGFESLLGEIQTAYGAEDLGALRARATPEMVSYFADDLAGNASRGVVNRVSDVKLLQGDLSEAWREGDVEYATGVSVEHVWQERPGQGDQRRVVDEYLFVVAISVDEWPVGSEAGVVDQEVYASPDVFGHGRDGAAVGKVRG